MTSTAIRGIGRLVTNDASWGRGAGGALDDAAVVLEGGRVAWVGPSAGLPEGAGDVAVDAAGRCCIPGFVDSHSHLVFAGDRAAEFADRASGRSYAPGGIQATVAATRAASTAELEALAGDRRRPGAACGDHDDGVQVRLRAARRRRGAGLSGRRARRGRRDVPRRPRRRPGVRRRTLRATSRW